MLRLVSPAVVLTLLFIGLPSFPAAVQDVPFLQVKPRLKVAARTNPGPISPGNFEFPESPLYPGKKYESAMHIGIHFAIALWRPDYSLVAAISIETAQTIDGRFELNDWVSRLSGCFAGYLINRFIFKHKKRAVGKR